MEPDTPNQPEATDALEQITQVAFSFADVVQDVTALLMRPWIAYQIAIALGVFLVAHIITAALKPRMHDWMRTLEGWPKWRMRILVILHRRMRLLIFIALIWCVALVMLQIYFPSRSYLLRIIAQLATAWFCVAFVTRFINNSLVRGIVRYGAWIWVTLSILNLTDETQAALDGAALELGTMRLSLWIIVQAVVLLAVLFAGARFLSTVASASIKRNEEMLSSSASGPLAWISLGLPFCLVPLVWALALVCKKSCRTLSPA